MNRHKTRALALALGITMLCGNAVPAIALAQDAVHGDVGAGIADVPDYLGSNQSHLRAVPVLNIGMNTPLFYLGNRYGGLPLQVGMTPLHTSHWTVGVDVAYQTIEPRNNASSSSNYPVGVPDIPRTALGGFFLQYRYQAFTASLRTESDLLGHGQGSAIVLDMRQSIPLNDRLTLGIGPQWTWGNREHMDTFFGINTEESIASQLHTYIPDSGSEEIAVLLNLRYLMTPKWVLGGGVSVGRLSGAIADSPLIIDRTQTRWTLFAAYRF